jgi:opacity protein-like surface antigen
MKKQILAALVTAATMGSASAAIVFQDNFESYTSTVTNGTYGPTTGTTLGPWTVTGTVDVIVSPNWGAFGSVGTLSLDNSGTPGAIDGISTSIATQIGYTYTLNFDYSRNFWGSNAESKTNLTFGSYTQQISLSGSQTQGVGLPFAPQSIAGTGGNITLSFLSPYLPNDSYGITLDNVVVTETITAAIPEPGEWAMMLSGLAVVGAIARRRRVRT